MCLEHPREFICAQFNYAAVIYLILSSSDSHIAYRRGKILVMFGRLQPELHDFDAGPLPEERGFKWHVHPNHPQGVYTGIACQSQPRVRIG